MTPFDFITLACFFVMAGAYFLLTPQHPRTLVHLMLPGIAFAVANQLGNADYGLLATVLIIAGAGYAAIVIRQG